jgi:hypothetical protein
MVRIRSRRPSFWSFFQRVPKNNQFPLSKKEARKWNIGIALVIGVALLIGTMLTLAVIGPANSRAAQANSAK